MDRTRCEAVVLKAIPTRPNTSPPFVDKLDERTALIDPMLATGRTATSSRAWATPGRDLRDEGSL